MKIQKIMKKLVNQQILFSKVLAQAYKKYKMQALCNYQLDLLLIHCIIMNNNNKFRFSNLMMPLMILNNCNQLYK